MHTTKSLTYNIIVILDKNHYFNPNRVQAVSTPLMALISHLY